jgi:hypothetical protein
VEANVWFSKSNYPIQHKIKLNKIKKHIKPQNQHDIDNNILDHNSISNQILNRRKKTINKYSKVSFVSPRSISSNYNTCKNLSLFTQKIHLFIISSIPGLCSYLISITGSFFIIFIFVFLKERKKSTLFFLFSNLPNILEWIGIWKWRLKVLIFSNPFIKFCIYSCFWLN